MLGCAPICSEGVDLHRKASLSEVSAYASYCKCACNMPLHCSAAAPTASYTGATMSL